MKLRNGKFSCEIRLLHPATQEITECNASSSSLVGSPAEVRNTIFAYIVGGQMIHVGGQEESFKGSTLCCARISETQAQKNFHATDPEVFEQPNRTHGWFGRFSEDGSRHHDCQERFSLAILYTCRQIYHDVKGVLYFSNTFSFRTPSAFSAFTSSLLKSSANLKSSVNQRFAIRSIHLDLQLSHHPDHDEWNKVIKDLPKYMPNVQSLYINLNLDIADTNNLVIQYSALMSTRFRLIGELYQLHVLPLKEVVVIVADEDWALDDRGEEWFSFLEQEYRWTMGQKQEYATELREVLLRSKRFKVLQACRA